MLTSTSAILHFMTAAAFNSGITAHDPFHNAPNDDCGDLRSVASAADMVAANRTNRARITAEDVDHGWFIEDAMVLDYWESRDDEDWWTPLCFSYRVSTFR